MDGSFLLPALAFMTLGVVIVLAVISKRRTDARHDDPNSVKSTLASDAPDSHAPGEARSDLPPASPQSHVHEDPPEPPHPEPPHATPPEGTPPRPDQSRTGK